MKKFIYKLLIFFTLLYCADYFVGKTYNLYGYLKGGEIGKAHQIMTQIEPDLIILGSSRASHHYNPQIIENQTSLNTYNAGFDGQGTYMDYGLLQGVTTRHIPRVILCELTPLFDLYIHPQSSSIKTLAPYASDYNLYTIFNDLDKNEKYKMISNSYVYNSKILRIISNILTGRVESSNGFVPINKVMKNENISTKKEIASFQVDSIKLKYFNKIIDQANETNITLIFAISPEYFCNDNTTYYGEIINLAEKRGIPVLNHLRDTRFVGQRDLFSDPSHLNIHGSELYSRIVAQEIDSILLSRKE